jgi:NADH-quinone oxidoreductase subunit E
VETLVETSLFDGSRAKPITLPNISGSGAGEPEPATEKKPTDDRQKTQARTGKATAKPAPRSKAKADEPEDAQPKKPAKPRAAKKTEG